MVGRKRRPSSQPKRHRMRRSARLVSARAWISKWMSVGRQVRAGDYARRYGVDRYTAHQEMVMIEAPIAPGDQRFAVRPPPVSRTRRRPPEPSQAPPCLVEWGGELIFAVGQTSGGVPFGLEEVEDIFDQEKIDSLSGEP